MASMILGSGDGRLAMGRTLPKRSDSVIGRNSLLANYAVSASAATDG
jgi:hypothetical protein